MRGVQLPQIVKPCIADNACFVADPKPELIKLSFAQRATTQRHKETPTCRRSSLKGGPAEPAVLFSRRSDKRAPQAGADERVALTEAPCLCHREHKSGAAMGDHLGYATKSDPHEAISALALRLAREMNLRDW